MLRELTILDTQHMYLTTTFKNELGKKKNGPRKRNGMQNIKNNGKQRCWQNVWAS